MADAPGSAVKIVHMPVQDVAHTMKAARLLYSAPTYVLRGPIYLIFLITFTALIYSFFGRVDKLVPCRIELKADYTKVAAPKRGIVKQVFVTEGAQILPFTPLVEIQVQMGVSDESEELVLQRQLDKIVDDIKWADKDRKDQTEHIASLKRSLRDETAKEGELEDRIRKERQEYDQRITDANRAVTTTEDSLKNAQDRVDAAKRDVDAAKVRAENAKKRFEEVKALVDKKLATVQELNQNQDMKDAAEKALADAQAAVRTAGTGVDQAKIQLDTAKDTPKKLALEWEQRSFSHNNERQNIRDRKSQLDADIKSAESGLEHGKEKLEKQKQEIEDKIKKSRISSGIGITYEGEVCKMKSIYGGTVTNVYAKKDQSVAAGEVLFSIVKDEEIVYGSLLIPNSKIGQVKTGDPILIKYDAYPYQEFGIQSGTLTYIGKKPLETDKLGNYEGRVSLKRQTIIKEKDELPVEGAVGKVLATEYALPSKIAEHVTFESGTTVTESMRDDLLKAGIKRVMVATKEEPLAYGLQGYADIKTGEQRLIEIVFSPVSKWFAATGD